MKKNILLTGASGYVGAMLADQLLKQEDVEFVIGIDKEKPDELLLEVLSNHKHKIFFIHKNLNDKSFVKDIEEIEKENNFKINTIIHTAWQIRELYGQKKKQWDWNVTGSDNVFDYAFDNKNINKLVHYSTVASYGAYPDNSTNYYFTESDNFRITDYLYAEEKRIVEEHLKSKYETAKNNWHGQVVIIRPAAITGPRGRFGRTRFGLQSALSGGLKREKSIAYKIVTLMTLFTPVTTKWLRQFVHEDDIVDLTIKSTLNKMPKDYDMFNICPPGDSVFAKDMAKAVNKKAIKIPPQAIRLAFFFAWHLTRGKVPTSKGSWKSYSYPIAVNGSKIANIFNYKYIMGPKEAFISEKGRYSDRYIKNN